MSKRKLTFFFVFFALTFVSLPYAHAGSFGPIKPSAGVGRISQEIGVFRFAGEWSGNNPIFDDTPVEQNQIFVQAGYGLDGNWEAYIRAGVADIRLKEGFSINDSAMEDDVRPFLTLGAKGLFYRGKNFHLGAFIQGSLYSDYEDVKFSQLAGERVKEELFLEDYWEADIGLAFQAEKDGFDIYFGPVLYLSRSQLDTRATILSLNAQQTFSNDYQEKEYIGTMFGLSIPISTYGKLCFEGQYKSLLSLGSSYVYFRFDY